MEALSETDWDLVTSGTGIPQSLLALSVTDACVLHVVFD